MGSSTQVAFVTGSTGLLGNHLVRHLVSHAFTLGHWRAPGKRPAYSSQGYRLKSCEVRGWPWGCPYGRIRINLSRFIKKMASFQLSGHSRSLRLHRDKLPLKSNHPCPRLQGSH